MGHEKFYGTPEGKFVAWQLEHSGAIYGPDTIEARFLRLHFIESEAKRISLERWTGLRILDLFAAAAVGKTEDGSRKSFMRKATEQLDNILDMASPFSEQRNSTDKVQELSNDQKLELLAKLNASKDKSDAGIMKTLLTATSKIAEKAN